jgi:hypothetical protein
MSTSYPTRLITASPSVGSMNSISGVIPPPIIGSTGEDEKRESEVAEN